LTQVSEAGNVSENLSGQGKMEKNDGKSGKMKMVVYSSDHMGYEAGLN